MVLPALTGPIALSPPSDKKTRRPQAASASEDADQLIEELMREAEADPGLREMAGMKKPPQVRRST